jgi:hypothetical protein
MYENYTWRPKYLRILMCHPSRAKDLTLQKRDSSLPIRFTQGFGLE